ncbi:MAG: Ppx/GppA phosphatase family protein [Aquificota bacterium]|nr:Ppx/GppA phosphatase family protein [Aquificota bacterium]
MRVAAVDIGSYSVRLTVAEVKDGSIRIIREMGRITALAKDLKETGRLRRDRMEETLGVLEEYRREAERLRVDKVLAVGTEALRRAENADEFLKAVRERTGIQVEIITPEEEGRLAFLAVAYSLRPGGYFLVVDQGGGSTEFVFGEGLKPDRVISLPAGIVNLTERFLRHDPPLEEEVLKLRDFVRESVGPLKRGVDEIVGLGGTITTLSALVHGVYPYDPSKVHGSTLTLGEISRWTRVLASLPSRERARRYPQIEDRRAEVILAGAVMFEEVLRVFGKDRIRVSDWGVKQGLIVRIILDR